MNFEDKLISILLREAKKDDEDPEEEEIFGIPMRKVPKLSKEELEKLKGKPGSKGAWSKEKRDWMRSMGEIQPEDPNAPEDPSEVEEGKTTGGDFEATFERLGRSGGERDKNPDAKPGEPGHRRINTKERRNRVSRKIMSRAWKQEVAKNTETRKRRDADAGGLEIRRNPETGEGDLYATNAPKVGGASDWEDMERQHREKQDFATSQGDTSYLNRRGLKRNIQQRSRAAVKRGKASVNEVSPPGWGHTKTGGKKSIKVGGTAAAMKKAHAQGRMPGVKNIFALMWSMKNKGDKPHYKPGKKGVLKKKYKKG